MHPSDDELELYSLGRLPEDRLASLEEHLLACEECRKRLAQADEYVAAMRQALSELNREAGEPAERRRRGEGFVSRFLAIPKPAWAGAAAAVALLLLVLPARHPTAAPFEIQLSTFRGGGAPLNAPAPAGRELILNLDITGLPALSRFQVEVVDSAGGVIYQGPAVPAGDTVRVKLGRSLEAGQYWVRIYRPTAPAGSERELLRELSLPVQ